MKAIYEVYFLRSDYSLAAPFKIYSRLVSVRSSLPCIDIGVRIELNGILLNIKLSVPNQT